MAANRDSIVAITLKRLCIVELLVAMEDWISKTKPSRTITRVSMVLVRIDTRVIQEGKHGDLSLADTNNKTFVLTFHLYANISL